MRNRTDTGKIYENAAAAYLTNLGYRILDRNWHSRFGELDLVCLADGVLIICEVKYRSSMRHGDPLESVTRTKQRKIMQTYRYYCMRNRIGEEVPCRFDVVGIDAEGRILHIKNAFCLNPD